jgi:hypothetical protein
VHHYAKRKDTEEGAAAAEPARIASVVGADVTGSFDRMAAAG